MISKEASSLASLLDANFWTYFPPLKEDHIEFEECDIPAIPQIQTLWLSITPEEQSLILKWIAYHYE